MELIFLTVDDVIFIQSEILSSASVTDIGKLESAIKRAEQYHYYESVNDIIELTAIYIIGIAKAHAFPDGNKRTSFLSATYFIRKSRGLRKSRGQTGLIYSVTQEFGLGEQWNSQPT